MAKTESEGLSTIGTSLGNAGISANSSTAAIEKADYMSGLDAQVGLQEQQLIARDQDLQASLIQGTQNDAKQEVGTSWLDTAGQVLGIAGNIAGDVATGGLSGIASSIGKSIFSGSNPGSVITPQASQLPGAITGGYGGSMPISIGQDPSLSELGF
jgi:phage-related minor tail protein